MSVFARLKPGATMEHCRRDMSAIAQRLEQEHPGSYPKAAGYTATSAALQEELKRNARPMLLVMLAAAAFRAADRLRQRCELDAGAHCAAAARAGGPDGAGGGERAAVAPVVHRGADPGAARRGGGCRACLGEPQPSGSVRGTVDAARAGNHHRRRGACALPSCVRWPPACFADWRRRSIRANNITAGLKESGTQVTGGGRSQWVRSGLIAAQVAFSYVLLVGAGLMSRTLINLRAVDAGFVAQHVLAVDIDLNWSKYTTDQQWRDVSRRLLDQAQMQPGVMSAAVSSGFPAGSGWHAADSDTRFQVEGHLPDTGVCRWPPLRVANSGLFSNAGHPSARRPGLRRHRYRDLAARRRDRPVAGATLLADGRSGGTTDQVR